MTRCDAVRPILFHVADGEAEPDEVLRVAIHVRECTACRIVLARDRRLVEILEGELGDPVRVPDDFTRHVMERLPVGRPPGARRRREALRRGLRVVGGSGLVALAIGVASKLHAPGVVGSGWSWGNAIEVGASRGLPSILVWLFRALETTLDRTGSGIRLDLPGLLPGWPGADVAIAASGAAVLLALTAGAVAARALLAAREE